jgi:hypothetical protein
VNGRVVVIDDKLEDEALPLMQVLSQKGISYRYFSGKESELPSAPSGPVRIVFLDIYLEGMSDSTFDEDQTPPVLAGVLDRIVGPDNGPYVIVAWTTHENHVQKVIDALTHRPTAHFDMDKSECKAAGARMLEVIDQKLDAKLQSIGAVRELFRWENLTAAAAAATVNQVTKGASANAAEVEGLFYQLAKANLGSSVSHVGTGEDVRAALQALSHLLTDSLDAMVGREQFNYTDKLLANDKIDLIKAAKLNTSLLTSWVPQVGSYPGSVYEEFDDTRRGKTQAFFEKRKEKILEQVRKNVKEETKANNLDYQTEQGKEQLAARKTQVVTEVEASVRHVVVEVSPVCDHFSNEVIYHRVIPGFLIRNHFKPYKKESAEAFTLTPPFYIEKLTGVFSLVLDFRGLMTTHTDILAARTSMFRFRQDQLFDLQHKAGSHFSRPGVTFIDASDRE